jgi:tellurite methyltransferase
MRQTITGFHRDAEGDWVAELSCGHNQHVRHRPPFMQRPWTVTEAGRDERLGTPLPCPPCARAEFPAAIRRVRSSPEWDERTVPPGLLRAHQLAAGTWGKLIVHQGALRFSLTGEPPVSVELVAGSPAQAIPPGVCHEVQPMGSVRFSIDFFTVGRNVPPLAVAGLPIHAEGGDPACWAGLLCPECGAVLTEDPHREGCSRSRH